jgi:hypothetical protein
LSSAQNWTSLASSSLAGEAVVVLLVPAAAPLRAPFDTALSWLDLTVDFSALVALWVRR